MSNRTVRWFLLATAVLLAQLVLTPAARGASISYRGSTTYSSAGGNVSSFTLTKPASALVTDVLVAQLTVKSPPITVTPPAGWSLVLSTSSPGNSLIQYVYYKVVTDTEPASYTWSISAARVVAAGLTACRGVSNNPATLVNASAAQTQGNTNGSITAPSITTTVANTMLLAFFGGASNTTITANTPLTNQYSLNNGGTNVADSAGYQPLAAAGATGTRMATVIKGTKTSGSGNAVGQMVALAPSAVDHFVIEAVGGGALPVETQKTPFNVQIRAVDASGTTVTSYGGKVTISSTGTLSAGSGTTGTFVNGVLSPWGLTYSNFGSFTITATDYTIPTITGSSPVTVNPVLDHFTVQAAGGGPIPNQTTGAPFSILITAQTSANTTLTSFTGTVNVTSTGTLSAGGGTSPNFTGGTLTQSVTIDNAGSWTMTATRTGGTETGTSNSFTVGAIGDFNVFESSLPAGTVNGYIATKVAGVPFGLAVVAVNTANNTVNTAFNDSVKVELLGSTRTGITAGSNNCPTNPADYNVLQTVAPAAIANGRSTVNFAAVADVWRETRARITYPATGTPTTIVCSDDVFAVRPDHLTVTVTDADWQTEGTSRTLTNTVATGGVVHKAGQPVTITVTAYNGSATPAVTGNYTVNYTPALTIKTFACQLPTGCATGTLALGSWGITTPGTIQTTTASYSEVGTFTLELQDLVFASDDVSDPVTPAVYPTPQGGGAMGVGRFVPDHFVLAATSTPLFKTFNTTDAACSAPVPPDTARSFTYIGQPFGYLTLPQLQVTAQNAGNSTTVNYRGTLWKIAPATDITQTYTNTAIPPDTPPPLTTSLQTPQVTPNNNGTGLVAANSADLLTFTRTPLAPQGSFNADISLATNVQDSSESGVAGNGIIASTGAVTFDGTGNGIDFDAGDFFVFGQLNLNPSPNPPPSGPDNANLTIPMWVEWWDDVDFAGQFAINLSDYCTSYSKSNVTLTTTLGTTAQGSGIMSQGQYAAANPLYLTAPSPTASGNVTVTHSAPPWLLYNNINPSVVATFNTPGSVTVLKWATTSGGAGMTAGKPGQTIVYHVQVSNTGGTSVSSVVVIDGLSPYTSLVMDAYGSSTPIQFSLGTSGVTVGSIQYSNDNGATYTYIPPASGPAPNVTNWKVTMNNKLNAGDSFTLQYQTIVK